MSKLITISNDILKASISTFGAELSSVIKDGKEIIWQADPNVWAEQCPILFPICGGLKEDKYIYDGKEYTLPKHGFAKLSEFEVESVTDTKAVFLLRSNEETLKNYPFEFEFRAIFELDGEKLLTTYETKNLSDRDMYFSVGGHEGYSCPNGIEEYSIIFEKPEKLERNTLQGCFLKDEKEDLGILDEVTELPLKYDYFILEAIVLTDLNSRKVTLLNRNTKEEITVEFPNHDYFLIWTKPGAKCVCLEPWCGLPDFIGSNFEIAEKRGIITLPSGETDTRNHIITF
ncbi:MAG: aldose 1-epimerase family protein [Ruminococcaceae bacterium]|nr:aldose 1-epimerase family protein [Oscillospiraceae bacterium]